MSKGRRDQRGRPASGKHCPESRVGGCAYCVTGWCKHDARHRARGKDAEQMLAEQLQYFDEQSEANFLDQGEREPPQHMFDGNRCVHCGCDDHSLPEVGETLAAWAQPCPVDGPERQRVWSFDVNRTSTTEPCTTCKGAGGDAYEICTDCYGSGEIPRT